MVEIKKIKIHDNINIAEDNMITGEVVITDDVAQANSCATQNKPYIVWLNKENRDKSMPSGAYCVENPDDIDDTYLERVYRRFYGIPWNIVETRRLNIREITKKDVPRLYELYADEEITYYMENLFPDVAQEIEYTENYIKNVYEFYGYGMWLITLKDSGLVIGRAGLECKEGFDGLELGFMLGKDFQGYGYAYEACSSIIKYGVEELGIKDYCAVVHRNNKKSIKLCEKLGLSCDKEMEDNWLMYTSKKTVLCMEKP